MSKAKDKEVYYFEELKEGNYKCVVTSMKQLVNLTGLAYRTIQEKFYKGSEIYHSNGSWKVIRCEFIRDGRSKNSNPNINY